MNRVTAAAPHFLTFREMDALQTLADYEFDRNEVVETMGISKTTLSTHLNNALSKLRVHSTAAAYVLGVREGFLK